MTYSKSVAEVLPLAAGYDWLICYTGKDGIITQDSHGPQPCKFGQSFGKTNILPV